MSGTTALVTARGGAYSGSYDGVAGSGIPAAAPKPSPAAPAALWLRGLEVLALVRRRTSQRATAQMSVRSV